eukprot:COSAG02_NODE_42509_length_384_cov_0.540351_1_plen_83_part_01
MNPLATADSRWVSRLRYSCSGMYLKTRSEAASFKSELNKGVHSPNTNRIYGKSMGKAYPSPHILTHRDTRFLVLLVYTAWSKK